MKKKFEAIFSQFAHCFSGACLVSDETGVLFSAASGLANRDHNIPNTMDTLFDTASVTKLFTAAAIIKLAEQGLLRLDDRIAKIIDLSGTKMPPDITIEQLLNHTSGIADDADEQAGEEYSALFVDKPNYAIRNCIDFLPQFAYKQPNFKAGTDVRYNNCAFVLLGLVLEALTETDYRTFVAEHIFKPCGMEHTRFYAKDEVCLNAAEGYFAVTGEDGSLVKWKKNIYSYPPIGTPDGGAYTTVGDLELFVRAIRDGKLLSKEYSDMLMTPHCRFTRQTRYGTWRTGYGFEFIESDGCIFCMYKEGVNPGVDAICAYYPELGISINILSNQNGPLWEMHRKMQDLLFEVG